MTAKFKKLTVKRKVEELIEILQSAEKKSKKLAAWALGEIKYSRAIEPLLAILKEEASISRGSLPKNYGFSKKDAFLAPILRGNDHNMVTNRHFSPISEKKLVS